MLNKKRVSPVKKHLKKVVWLLKLAYWIWRLIDQASNYARPRANALSIQNAV